MGFDWKSALSKVAPMIGTAIGGPFGGMAASAALDLLGIEPEKGNEEQQLQQAIASMTPEQAIALKTAEMNWRATMREIGLKEEDLHARDRDSARQMATARGAGPQIVLSVVYTMAYAVVLWLFLTGKVNVGDNRDLILVLMGILTTAQTQILNFWFGSSSGSKEKTAAMAFKA